MRTVPRLVQVLNPPPFPTGAEGNLLAGGGAGGADLTTAVPRALRASLAQSFPSSSGSSSSSTPFKVCLIHVHPCQPVVAYLAVPSGPSAGGGGVAGGGGGGQGGHNHPGMGGGQVVVQHVHTRQVLFRTSLGEIAAHLSSGNDNVPATVQQQQQQQQRQAKFLKDLGAVQRLDLVDPSTLYWGGYLGDGNGVGPRPPPQRWFYLLVQFQNRIVVLNLRRHGLGLMMNGNAGGIGSIGKAATAPFVPILADITPASLMGGTAAAAATASISSNAVPVSASTIVVACADGTLKLYDWRARTVVRSVSTQGWGTASSGSATPTHHKNDHVVEIVSTNPFPHTPAELYDDNRSGGTAVSMTLPPRQRSVVCLTRKGGAYLCPLVMTASGGGVVDVAPPVARMEGGSVPASMSRPDDDHHHHQQGGGGGSMDHALAHYDAHRDLLLWLVPAKSKSRLLVWELGPLMAEDRARQLQQQQKLAGDDKDNNSNRRRQQQPADSVLKRPDPTLVVQFPLENVSHSILPGWSHEAVPRESMTCLAVTKEGELHVFVAPLHNSGSTWKHPFHAVTVSRTNLLAVARRDLDVPDESANPPPSFRVRSVHCPALRDSSTLSVGTSVGILQVRMAALAPFRAGTRVAHLSANAGAMGRAVLSARGSQISYTPLGEAAACFGGTAGGSDGGPVGRMMASSDAGPGAGGGRDRSTVVYESPPPLHLPPEIHKRPVRLPPLFLASPSRTFLCCFWREEMRYEILSVPAMLERVTSRNPDLLAGQSPVVASGNGAASFAWVGDDDVFCLLYDPEQDLALKVGIDLSSPEVGFGREFADLTKVKELKKLKELARLKTYKKGVKSMVGTAGKLKSLEGLRDLGKDTGKLGIGAVKLTGKLGLGTVKLTGKVAMGVTQGAVKETSKVSAGVGKIGLGATKSVTKMAVGGTKKGAHKMKKMASFGMWKKKSQDKKGEGSLANAEMDDEDEAPSTNTTPMDTMSEYDLEAEEVAASEQLERKYPWVELRILVAPSAGADGTVSSTTASNLGQLTLRSGNRNPPTVLFGGPVLCVGSKLDESDEGLAYFYTKKKGQEEESASTYVSSGPAFPCPDIVVWDDDGRLCAVVIHGMVSIYLSDEPNFVMLGTTRVGSASDVNAEVVSCRFIHGVLYCTTRSSVQCIFLGDLDGGVCHLDSFILASSDVPSIPSRTIVTDYHSLTPPTIPMPLNYPEVLGYQSGSLILSTASGIVALSLGFPLIRIGTLISAGPEHYPKAEKWFDAVPNCDHEVLATFLERRGVPEMALQLPGVSLETTVDTCMRFGYIDKLEETVEMYGLDGLRAIDMSRGVSTNVFGPAECGTSIVVCVGAYLLSYGRVELVRRLATECLAAGQEGKQEAFLLAGLLLSVNASDAKRVLQRSVEDADEENWLVGSFVRNHILGNIPN